MSLRDILRQQRQLLDSVFGEGAYSIKATDPDIARVCADWMELLLVYDLRDQFVSSAIRPLRVPVEEAEDHTSDTLLRFCGIEVGARRKSTLDERQVVDELALVTPLVGLLKDEQKSRAATWFVRGYNAAYTDWASGKFD